MHGITKGDRIQSPVTTTLIWSTIAVGLGEISEENASKFYTRLNAYERLFGAFMHRGTDWPEGKEPFITPEEVISHIGLGCNVSNETDTKWRNRILTHFVGDTDRVFKRASDKLDAAKLPA